jgi:hypothetical protein
MILVSLAIRKLKNAGRPKHRISHGNTAFANGMYRAYLPSKSKGGSVEMANPITVLSFANMVYPTSTLLLFAGFVVAVLIAADWYVWGRTYATDFRSPQTVKPQSDFIERFLVRTFAINQASVTRTAAIPGTLNAACVSTEDCHGFKKVA